MIKGPIILTGAGGDIGIALARCLKEALPAVTLIGADSDRNAVGAEFVDRFLVLPRADAPVYVGALREAVTETGAQALIPLSEAELARLLREDLLAANFENARLVTANHKAVAIGLDKFTTAEALRKAGIATPETGIVGDHEPGDYDLILKPRSGQGSKGLLKLARAEFESVVSERKGDLWQRWLKNENEEFTCGLTRFASMPTRSLSFRRTLLGGLTGNGEVVQDNCLTEICERVAAALDLDGAINVQLRMDAGKPMIFEINPRFSSTVGFRHRLGFRDALWAIQDRLGLAVEDYEPPADGTRIDRVALEVIRPPLA